MKYVAGRISVNLPPNVELNDLINDGVVGLIDAIEKYDDDRGVKFETYAITRIHGAIIDALRALDWVPRAIRQKARELERTQHELEAELGEQPTDDEVATRMGISKRELEGLQQKVRGTSVLSLEEHLPNDRGNDIPLLDTLKGDDGDLASTSSNARFAKRSLQRWSRSRNKSASSSSSTTSRARRSKRSSRFSKFRNRGFRKSTHKRSFTYGRNCASSKRTWVSATTIRRSNRSTCVARIRRPAPRSQARSVATRRLRGAREVPLFSTLLANPGGDILIAGDGDVRLYRAWLDSARADALLHVIRETTRWTQERRKMYDRFVDVPREQAWFGSGPPGHAMEPMGPELADVRDELAFLTGTRFSYVLLNRYRTGADSVAWHNDCEVRAIVRPTIASLTLGATRAFDLRPKADRARVVSVDLDHGDLVVMRGETQANYEHRIAKDPRIAGERINLTYRQVASAIEQEFDPTVRRG